MPLPIVAQIIAETLEAQIECVERIGSMIESTAMRSLAARMGLNWDEFTPEMKSDFAVEMRGYMDLFYQTCGLTVDQQVVDHIHQLVTERDYGAAATAILTMAAEMKFFYQSATFTEIVDALDGNSFWELAHTPDDNRDQQTLQYAMLEVIRGSNMGAVIDAAYTNGMAGFIESGAKTQLSAMEAKENHWTTSGRLAEDSQRFQQRLSEIGL